MESCALALPAGTGAQGGHHRQRAGRVSRGVAAGQEGGAASGMLPTLPLLPPPCCCPWLHDPHTRPGGPAAELRTMQHSALLNALPLPPVPCTPGCGRCRRRRHTCLLRFMLMWVPGSIQSAPHAPLVGIRSMAAGMDGLHWQRQPLIGRRGIGCPPDFPSCRPSLAAMPQRALVLGGWAASQPPSIPIAVGLLRLKCSLAGYPLPFLCPHPSCVPRWRAATATRARRGRRPSAASRWEGKLAWASLMHA